MPVELVDWDGAAVHADAWADLAARALEPNAFLEPDFVLPAVQHIPVSRRPSFLFVWMPGVAGAERRLIGVLALHPPRSARGAVLRLWASPMMGAGAPLLDRTEAHAAIGAVHDYVARRFPGAKTIVFPQLHLEGPVARVIAGYGEVRGMAARVFDRRSRAIVTGCNDPARFAQDSVTPKRHKELRRQRRRLEELGALEYRSITDADGVRDAMERFLALEAAGWKGGRATALLSDPSTATFARTMVRNFARRGACRIDVLELDGRPIAMGIVLSARDTAFYWKTAYDEAYARYSPGVLFSLDMTARMIAEGAYSLINSCAVANHPMIDRIWRERMDVGDLAAATLNAPPRRLAFALKREATQRQLRSAAKNIYHALRRRQPR